MSRSHPQTTNKIIAFIARHRWQYLLLVFVLAIVGLSALFAALDAIVSGAIFTSAFIGYLAYFFGAEGLAGDGPRPAAALAILAGFLRLLMHAIVLGTVVFKLMVPQQLLRFRNRCFIRKNDKGQWELVLRLYNATDTEIVDLSFEAYLRTPVMLDARTRSQSDRIEDIVVPFVRNRKLIVDAEKRQWPISIQYVPYSVPIALSRGDVCFIAGRPHLRAIQGHPVTPTVVGRRRGETFLTVLVKGHIPSLGSEIVETQWFQMSGSDEKRQLEFGDFHDISVVPGNTPRRAGGNPHAWRNWEKFDDSRPIPATVGKQLVFGYGSLVDVRRLGDFMAAHALAPGRYRYCTLPGYQRVWNVAMDNRETLASYKYYVDKASGQRPDVRVAFLNIEPVASCADTVADRQAVTGILFEVNEAGLAALDQRERNYCRIDVGDLFPGYDVPVWVYVGRHEAEERYRLGIASNTAVIDANYKNEVEQAFAAANLPYAAVLDPRVKVVDLERIAT